MVLQSAMELQTVLTGLKDSKAKSKVMILLTDGVNNAVKLTRFLLRRLQKNLI